MLIVDSYKNLVDLLDSETKKIASNLGVKPSALQVITSWVQPNILSYTLRLDSYDQGRNLFVRIKEYDSDYKTKPTISVIKERYGSNANAAVVIALTEHFHYYGSAVLSQEDIRYNQGEYTLKQLLGNYLPQEALDSLEEMQTKNYPYELALWLFNFSCVPTNIDTLLMIKEKLLQRASLSITYINLYDEEEVSTPDGL
jgi:hypothetical protein